MARLSGTSASKLSIRQKFLHLNWEFVLLIILTASIGFAMLFSAANGDFDPWALRQAIRFAVGVLLMLAVAFTDIQVWFRAAYQVYAVCLALLAAVEIMGSIGMGAQRWLDLGFFQLQPSELMKVAVVLALARYFHGLDSQDTGRLSNLFIPVALVAVPMALVLRQPDLGTAGVVAMVGAAMFWLGGARLWQFATVAASAKTRCPACHTALPERTQRSICYCGRGPVPGGGQRMPQPTDDQAANNAGVAESDLGLRRMHIYVDYLGIDLDE